jgi:tRNA modification GTPase
MAGLVVELTDTAGLGAVDLPQEPADQAGTLLRVALEQAAQDRARERVAVADVGLWVADATLPLGRAPELPEGAARLLVWNQIDRPEAAAAPCLPGLPTVAVSALTGDGVDRLRQVLRELLVAQVEGTGIGRETAARQALALDGLLVELSAALEALEGGLELAAEHLARAQSALGSLGGESTPEDVLDRIFSRFCLGK